MTEPLATPVPEPTTGQEPTPEPDPVVVPRPQHSGPLLGAAILLGLLGGVLVQGGSGTVFGLIGLLALAAGGLALAFGVYRAAGNLDTLAAAAYLRWRRDEG